MSGEGSILLVLICFVACIVLLPRGTGAASLKAGKVSITTSSPGSFACKQILFAKSFSGRKDVKVLASFGHSVKNPTRGNGAAIWVESEGKSQFRACIYEYGDGSNTTAEINWLAVQSAPSGAQMGTTSLDSWTTGTECKKIDFPQRFVTPPTILVTPIHQSPERPQDAMAVWVEDSTENSFKVCLREVKIFDGLHRNIKINWMAFTNLSSRVKHFKLTDSLVFTNNNSPSQKDNYAFCQKINFTDPLFAPPVVVVTPKLNNSNSHSSLSGSGCNAITVWVEYASTTDTEICVKNYDGNRKDITIKVDYLVIGDLDPCLDVICDYHGLCKAFGPYDARCVCVDSCPSYHEPICSSSQTTYDNKCLFEQEMCLMQINYTVQHPGSCEGFPFQSGRRHMPHIPSLGYSHCEVIRFTPFVFYPNKPIEVQITVNHIDTSDKSYVHDAAVSWIEDVNYDRFTVCVMAAGFNERKSRANVSVDWMAYQGAPVGGVTGEVRISQWWTGTTCKTVNVPSKMFPNEPSVFVTAAHHHAGLKRDAASIWLEDITQSSFKICLRELQNYAGSHKDISVNWLVFSSLHKPLFSEHSSVYFANSQNPPVNSNNAFCKDIQFAMVYKNAPNVFVSANHSSSVGNQDPMHNSITAWVEYINTTGARVCLKELYESKYDPLSVTYTVLSDLDECNTNSFTCDVNAACQNTVGSYTCSCKAGYTGDGKTCNDLDECATNSHTCDVNAACQNTVGSYSCSCKAGYTGDGKTCKDLDECATNSHTCDVNAACQNTVGSYSCSCKAGYTGDGKTCKVKVSGECLNYQTLASSYRKVTHGSSPLGCDNTLRSGWYRFQGNAGTKMPTSCVSPYRCGTHATGWLNGAHPTVQEGKVTRKVCFSWASNCCYWSINIQVLNCSSYFLYFISGTPPEHPCHLRYCGTD